MKINIKYVKDAGDIKKERIVLKVISDDDAGNYMLADTTYLEDGSISNKLRHIYWIPDQVVNADDLVVAYTKEGEDSKKNNKNGTTTYFFYWGLDRTVWNKEGDGAVLFSIKDWVATQV